MAFRAVFCKLNAATRYGATLHVPIVTGRSTSVIEQSNRLMQRTSQGSAECTAAAQVGYDVLRICDQLRVKNKVKATNVADKLQQVINIMERYKLLQHRPTDAEWDQLTMLLQDAAAKFSQPNQDLDVLALKLSDMQGGIDDLRHTVRDLGLQMSWLKAEYEKRIAEKTYQKYRAAMQDLMSKHRQKLHVGEVLAAELHQLRKYRSDVANIFLPSDPPATVNYKTKLAIRRFNELKNIYVIERFEEEFGCDFLHTAIDTLRMMKCGSAPVSPRTEMLAAKWWDR